VTASPRIFFLLVFALSVPFYVLGAPWHVIPFIQLGSSGEWIMWHSLSSVAVLFHMMINVSWALFPVAGSYYDPFVTFILLAASAGLIVLFWRPSTKHRNSFA
jgi:uncharacterized protein